MEMGKVSTNAYLRRIHNFALGKSRIPAPIIPKRQWPAFRRRERRAITFQEHEQIIACEPEGCESSFPQHHNCKLVVNIS